MATRQVEDEASAYMSSRTLRSRDKPRKASINSRTRPAPDGRTTSEIDATDDDDDRTPVEKREHPRRWMMFYMFDPANLVTLGGLVFGCISFSLIVRKRFHLAMCSLMVSCLCDWLDGTVARALPLRDPSIGRIGANLDSLCDLVNFGALPALTVHIYLGGRPLADLVCVMYVCVAIRLAYYNVFGLEIKPGERPHFVGCPVDRNSMALALAFLAEPFLAPATFAIVLPCVLVAMALLNISTIPTPKHRGPWEVLFLGFIALQLALLGGNAHLAGVFA